MYSSVCACRTFEGLGKASDECAGAKASGKGYRRTEGGWSDSGGEGSLFDRHDILSMKSRSPSHMPWHQTHKVTLQHGEHAFVAGVGRYGVLG